MKTISLKVSETLDSKLDHAARERHWTRSQLVRVALDEFLLPARSRPTELFRKRARRFAGAVKSGPGDLATNRRHLDDFGR